jgi:hypothetical protein
MKPVRGFHHHHDDEALRRYRALSAEQKLRWLYAAWRLTVDFLPKKKLDAYQRMRKGEI